MAEFLPHNSAINSRFQSEIWPIFENHATKNPAHLGILRVRGGSSVSLSASASTTSVADTVSPSHSTTSLGSRSSTLDGTKAAS